MNKTVIIPFFFFFFTLKITLNACGQLETNPQSHTCMSTKSVRAGTTTKAGPHVATTITCRSITAEERSSWSTTWLQVWILLQRSSHVQITDASHTSSTLQHRRPIQSKLLLCSYIMVLIISLKSWFYGILWCHIGDDL